MINFLSNKQQMIRFFKNINFQKIKTFDTITTKLLLLVLFTTIIPLFVIMHFSINMLTKENIVNTKIVSSDKKIIAVSAINPKVQKENIIQKSNFIMYISIASFFVAIIIAILFSRAITTPVLKLVKAANYLADGNLDYRLEIKGNDEIAKLSKTFNKMANNLKKQQQLRDNFIAALTHDLKVPMLAENQTVKYLLKGAYGSITEEQKEVLELIKSTNNASLEMICTLLDVYKYDMGIVNPIKQDFNFISLLKESINEIKSLAEEKKINILIQNDKDEIILNADKSEIKRVLHNLMSNAISNGIYRGNIECEVQLNTQNKKVYNFALMNYDYSTLRENIPLTNTIMISIKDDGVGISREDMDLLFKRFSLSKGRNPAGTGIGLFYSLQVIKSYGGYIWAESTEGKGSRFSFILPLCKK